MKFANVLLVLAIIATSSAFYLERRTPAYATRSPDSAPVSQKERLSTEVIELRRELKVVKAQLALLQKDRTQPRDSAARDSQTSAPNTARE